VYLTSINTGRAVRHSNFSASADLSHHLVCVIQFNSPRLVFVRAPADGSAHFFAMSLNNSGDRVTFVDPPAAVANSLGLSLRAAFPHRILNEHTTPDGIFTIILKSGINGALYD
jgi:hypothetical protein